MKNYLHVNKRRRLVFNNRQNFFFFSNPNFKKGYLPTYLCLRWNCLLFLILTYWTYSKSKDIFDMLNVYKILAKEHQLGDCRAADEMPVS